MEKRRGVSLSSKMILTTTGLILGVVGLFGFLLTTQINRMFDDAATRLRESTEANLQKRGEVQARTLVQALKSPLLNNDFGALQAIVPQLTSKDDPLFAYAFLADKDGQVMAHTDPSKNGKKPDDAVGRKLLESMLPGGQQFEPERGKVRLLGFSRPIEDDRGTRVGTVALAFDLAPLDAEVAKIEADKARQNHVTTVRTVLLGVMFILFGSALAVFQGMRISGPIHRLAISAERIAQGDLSSRADVSSSDEIGRLGESFNYMANQLVILLDETREKAVLEKELEIARAIQETLVPPSDLFERNGVRVCGFFQPSSQVGGDWWTVNELPGNKTLVVIGDVTGHGTPAAMITAAAKAACDTLRHLAADKLTPARLLEVMNTAIFESARRRFVMTCFAAVIDARAKTITFANAGHNFPYLFRAKSNGERTEAGAGDAQELQILMSRGNPLGDVMDSTYVEKSQPIEVNDVLVWYTDGIVECENTRGEEFGEKRFRAAIKAASALEPAGMRDQVMRVASEFYGEQPHKDDITMVFARVTT